MKHFDVLILGRDESVADLIAAESIRSGKKVAIVVPPLKSFPLGKILQQLSGASATPFVTSLVSGDVEIIEGQPSFSGKKSIQVNGQTLEARQIVIATGARADESIESFLFESSSNREPVTIVGAGPLGVSLAIYAATLGRPVTLMGREGRLWPNEEPEISAALAEQLKQKRVNVAASKNQVLEHPSAVNATGVIPITDGLNLKEAGVYVTTEGAVAVDDNSQTSAPGIFAAGHVTGRKSSLSLMILQAEAVSRNLTAPFFSRLKIESEHLPFTVPTDPPFARLGWTEREARLHHKDIHVSVVNDERGIVKIVGRRKGARLLGAHLLAPHSAEAILFFNLALRAEISIADLTDRPHYPPFSTTDLLHAAILKW
jgi:mercuric reductase